MIEHIEDLTNPPVATAIRKLRVYPTDAPELVKELIGSYHPDFPHLNCCRIELSFPVERVSDGVGEVICTGKVTATIHYAEAK